MFKKEAGEIAEALSKTGQDVDWRAQDRFASVAGEEVLAEGEVTFKRNALLPRGYQMHEAYLTNRRLVMTAAANDVLNVTLIGSGLGMVASKRLASRMFAIQWQIALDRIRAVRCKKSGGILGTRYTFYVDLHDGESYPLEPKRKDGAAWEAGFTKCGLLKSL